MLERSERLLGTLALLLLTITGPGRAQDQTIGLFLNGPSSYDGYTLFESGPWRETYLINNEGLLIHSWTHDLFQGSMARILENGNLLRGGDLGSQHFTAPGGGGLVQEIDWDGNLVWEFTYSNEEHHHHHDMARLPSGNVLLLAWEEKSLTEAIQAGRNPALLPAGKIWPEHIVEVEPIGASGGNIVWEWHVWDHLIQDFDSTKANFGVVADHPELIDINFTVSGGADWLHANAIAYNEDLDQIVISINLFSEFWILDHSTTTAEAAGHTGGARGMGGDILYRWGNPRAYDRGNALDRRLYRQHSTHWIAPGLPGEGRILLFNNGFNRPEGQYSSVEEIETSVDANGDYPVPLPGQPHEPEFATWVYTATPPEALYAAIISGAQRLPNGNTLIDDGAPVATFQEIDPQEELVWLYVNPVDENGPMIQGEVPSWNPAFRVTRYALDYAGFEGKDLTPGSTIEIYPTGIDKGAELRDFALHPSFPNPFDGRTEIRYDVARSANVTLRIYDVAGRLVRALESSRKVAGSHQVTWDGLDDSGRRAAPGVYFYRLDTDGFQATRKMVVMK
jgi:hypothetical protein